MKEVVTIKSSKDIEILREGGKRLSYILGEVVKAVRPGILESELDIIAERLINEGGDKPAFKNYKPDGSKIAFPASLCVSVNNEVVHGIPEDKELKNGDIVGLDLGLEHKGLFTDMAVTVPVGVVDGNAKKLIKVTRNALESAIKAIKDGVCVGDIGEAINSIAIKNQYSTVKDLSGHGVGYEIHEPPYVPNFGKKGKGFCLLEGMVIAIEPMLNEGSEYIEEDKDNFTVITEDGKRSAHFEKTVVVTKKGAEVLTPFPSNI